ncbi:MAG: dephospho-CoA kinase [Planctomycetales bacterium]|nr:dephospho-CoA kinase [Planctomycetales bacterium]
MLILGVVGGVASGKSLVSELFVQLGAERLDGDAAGHAALRDDTIKQQILQRFGTDVFDSHHEIDRRALAKIVFAPTPAGREALADLERITHPRIGQLLDAQIAAARSAGRPAAVLDAAVMDKAGWDRRCDRIVFVDAPREQRLARALLRGWSEEEFAQREASQSSVSEKQARADYTIDNSNSIESTRRQTIEYWNTLGLPIPH